MTAELDPTRVWRTARGSRSPRRNRVDSSADQSPGPLVRPVLLLLLSGGVLGVLVWAGLSHAGHSVRPWLVVGLSVSAAAVVAVLRVAVVRIAPPVALPRGVRARVRTDRELGGTRRLARTLDGALSDPDRFDLRVRPLLTGLAEHALRRRHGVDLRSQPERARELLGDSLWQTIRTAPATPPSRRELAEWVQRLEAL